MIDFIKSLDSAESVKSLESFCNSNDSIKDSAFYKNICVIFIDSMKLLELFCSFVFLWIASVASLPRKDGKGNPSLRDLTQSSSGNPKY